METNETQIMMTARAGLESPAESDSKVQSKSATECSGGTIGDGPTHPSLGRCLAVRAAQGHRSKAVRAAVRYILRRDRHEHPDGERDNAGRWYPAVSENLDTSRYRSPSRAWPWSYMLPCRTLAHCAQLEDCTDLLLARRIARAIDKATTCDDAVRKCRALINKAQKASLGKSE